MQKKPITLKKSHRNSWRQSEYADVNYLRDLSSEPLSKIENRIVLIFQKSESPLTVYLKAGERISIALEEVGIFSSSPIMKFDGLRPHIFILSFSDKAVREAISENKLNSKEVFVLKNLAQRMTPTSWLKSLLTQYFYETVLMLDSPPGCTFFLEKQIINEVMRCLFSNYYLKNEDDSSAVFDAETYEIIKYIEAHLNEEHLSVSGVAKSLGMSESSLLRRFKLYIGKSPRAYIKARRLDEASRLIKSEKMGVSEACYAVGYSDFSSFSKSFKIRFGISPSQVE